MAISVYPNPSHSHFTLEIRSETLKDKVTVRMLDVFGKVMEIRTALIQQRFEMGYNLRPGIYYVEAIQGREKIVVKLIKGAH